KRALEMETGGNAAERATAIRAIQALARKGDIDAQYELARICETGEGLKAPDPAKAVFWADRAAEGGSTRAMVLMGLYWTVGFGVDPDEGAAVRSLTRAYDGGSALGALLLALRHGGGEAPDAGLVAKALECSASEIVPYAALLEKTDFPAKAWEFIESAPKRP
ncbi:MAG: sel1 repeat family protein, partial [Kiritimatiellae bacterium]|nr:sel1 repeat family protein [Kiritimatiellia bacterium]